MAGLLPPEDVPQALQNVAFDPQYSGMRLEYLPAYSPDLNPIEEAFSCIKSHFRRHHAHFARLDSTGTDINDMLEIMKMLFDVVYSVTAAEARGFYKHSGFL